jgi:hypothetical protein
MKLTKKETLFVLLAATLVLLLVASSAFAARDQFKKKRYDGKWKYMPASMEVLDVNACDSQFYFSDDAGDWSGILEGVSHDDCVSVMHASGRWFGYCTAVFPEATFNGKEGELELGITILKTSPESNWVGEFVVTDASGELENLRVFGTIWGPGYDPAKPEKWGVIYYTSHQLDVPLVGFDN